MAFDQKTRNLLQRTVSACRNLLDAEFASQRRSIFGINDDGTAAPLETLSHLSDEDMQTARLLRDRLNHLVAGLVSQGKKESEARKEAGGRLTREQAFTVLNRLAALRMSEEREIVLECVRLGTASEGFQLFMQTAGGALGSNFESYRSYLFLLFDELAIDLGVLFSRWDPAGLLFPRQEALEAVLRELNGTGTAATREDITPEAFNAIWAEDETIGWIYQYYNDQAERKKMRDESSAPRNSRELAVRNQFFTPRYVVEFLTDNTLGRIWYEMTQGKTKLKEQCRYLVRRPTEVFLAKGESTPEVVSGQCSVVSEEKETEHRPQSTDHLSQEDLLKQPVFIPHRPIKDPRTILMLDPACGSMHFGLYAFDLFEVIYDEAWEAQLSVVGGRWSENIHEQAEILSRIAGLAEGDGTGGSDLPVDQGLSEGGNLRTDESAAAGSGVGAFEHRRGPGPELDSAVSPASVNRLRVADGNGNPNHDLPEAGVSHPGSSGIAHRTDLRNREDVERAVRRAFAQANWPLTTDHRPLFLDYPNKDAFLKDVPRLIIEHNIHGIDIDPRAAQIAGLALWLRAQKAWQRLGLNPAERPAIRRSNIVCAEPMPGEKELLREFVEREFPAAERAVCLRLLEAIFDKMQLAGEAGSLLKIEEEIRSAIEDARDAWQKLATKPPELFTTTEMSGATDNRSLTTDHRSLTTDHRPLTTDHRSLTTDHRSLTTDFWERLEERIYAALRDYAEQAENGGGFQRRLFAEDAARGFAFIDVCRKRYDVALMNPPFGKPATKSLKYLKEAFPDDWKDIYAAFFTRNQGVLAENGALGAITSLLFFYSKQLRDLRQTLIQKKRLRYAVELGSGVLDTATVDTALSVITAFESATTGFLDLTSTPNKGEALLEQSSEARFDFRRLDDFKKIFGWPLCYHVHESKLRLWGDSERLEPSLADIVAGNHTFDDFRFLRLLLEVPSSEFRTTWVPYEKGGEFQPFFSPTELAFNWADEGAEARSYQVGEYGTDAQTIQSISKWFRAGLTFPRVSSVGFSPRVLPAGCIFSEKGMSIFLHKPDDKLPLLGLLSSSWMEDLLCAFGRHRAYENSAVANLPFGESLLNRFRDEFTELAVQAIAALQRVEAGVEGSPFFLCLSEVIPTTKDAESPADCIERTCSQIDLIASKALFAEERDAVSLVSDDRVSLFRKHIFHPPKLDQRSIDEISWCFGVAFGRWDIRYATGEQAAPELPDPFAPLPVCPPGQLQNAQGLPARPEDVPAAYPVRIPWDGILVDDPNHPLDLERRVREVLGIVFSGQGSVASGEPTGLADSSLTTDHRPLTTNPTDHRSLTTDHSPRAEAIEAEACEILGVKSLRDYFRKPAGFFADHLKRYSKSRRQAPIYWPLSTASGSYTLWIYYHRLTPDTLYKCLQQFVEPKMKDVEQDIHHLRTMLAADEAGSKERKQLADAETLLNELKEMHAELSIWAPKWKPNLNDGVLITASPLWKLFRLPKWRTALEACWKNLNAGDYDWAHLAHTLWPTRVREKCKTDRSLAIAHGLQELCEIQAPVPKKRAAKKAAKNISKKATQGNNEEKELL
jgi:hypothetical protein